MTKRKTKKNKINPSTANSWSPWLANTRLHSVFIFLFAALLYINTLSHDYALDDAIVIYDNEFTTQGFAGIDELFKYDTFRGFFKEEGKANLVAGGRYRPFTPAMFAVEYALFGKNPTVGHIGNMLFYGLLCMVLYWVLLQLFREKTSEGKALFVALAASMIFAAHPVHTEVVANIKGRDEIMTLLGSLAALGLSVKAWQQKKMLWTVLAALCFFIGLLSKENAITFLGIIPLAFWIFTKASIKEIAAQMLPLFVVAGLFLALRANAIAPPPDMPAAEVERILNRPKDLMNDPFQKLVGNTYQPLSTAEKSATITHTLGVYLRLLVAPVHLTHDYYPRHIDIKSWSDLSVILSFLLYLLIAVAGIYFSLKRNVWGFVCLFYLATFSVVSNIFFPIGTNMAERFLFLPSLSFALAIALLVYYFIDKQSSNKSKKYTFGLIAVNLLCFVFLLMTVSRNPVWKNNYTLFTTDIAISKNSAKLRNSVGGELIANAIKPEFSAGKDKMLNEALVHLQEAVRLHPGYKNAYLLQGNAFNYLNRFEEAFVAYQNALLLDSNYEEAENNLTIAYREAGKYYGEKKGDINQALTYLQKAYQRNSNDFETVRLLGVAYGQTNDKHKAVEYFTKATQIAPDNAGAWYDLGTAYYFIGDEAKRAAYHEKAMQIDPNFLKNRGG